MDENYRQRSLEYWEAAHARQGFARDDIKTDGWLDEFEEIIRNAAGPVLDLGCGGGNDTLYLINRGKQVCACDLSPRAVEKLRENFPEVQEARCLNMLDGLPFDSESFEVVIADLCLHYFTRKDTEAVVSEIRRILTPGGHLMMRVNSIHDIHYGAGQGKEIEHHVFETREGTLKRFFDEEDVRFFFREFDIVYLREETMIRYGPEKRLFRACVRKGKV